MGWSQLLALLGALLIIWILFRVIRAHPEGFSKENFRQSLFTMGVLALLLIGFIALCILLLSSSAPA